MPGRTDKKDANYRPARMHAQALEYDLNCGSCNHFEDSKCELVKGSIDEDYYCDFYKPLSDSSKDQDNEAST